MLTTERDFVNRNDTVCTAHIRNLILSYFKTLVNCSEVFLAIVLVVMFGFTFAKSCQKPDIYMLRKKVLIGQYCLGQIQ